MSEPIKIQRPRGEFSLVMTETKRKNESGTKTQFPFLQTSDQTLEKMAQFLASEPEDSESYSAFEEINEIVVAALRQWFQTAWQKPDSTVGDFIKHLENPSFSGRKETMATISTKMAKQCAIQSSKKSTAEQKAAAGLEIVKLMVRLQEFAKDQGLIEGEE